MIFTYKILAFPDMQNCNQSIKIFDQKLVEDVKNNFEKENDINIRIFGQENIKTLIIINCLMQSDRNSFRG